MIDALSFSSGAPGSPYLAVWMVNVGQGNCIIVEFPNGNYMLVDAGSTSSSPGASTILGNINAIMGKNTFTTVVLTHPDDDHCNLIPYITQATKPKYVHFSMTRTDYSAEIQTWFNAVGVPKSTVQQYGDNYYQTAAQKDFGDGNETNVYVLAANVAGDKNTHSIVLSIDFKNYTIMLTGDATSTTERFILSKWDDMSLMGTLLGFGHHGSSHSSSKKFLSTVKADVGIFSASAQHMGYGHPRCSVYLEAKSYSDSNGKNGRVVQNHRIECWQDTKTGYVYYNIRDGIFLTATQKDILFYTDGNKYKVQVDTLGV